MATTAQPRRALPRVFGVVARPFEQFFRLEAASGLLLLASAVLAMGWANSPWKQSYVDLFSLSLGVRAGGGLADFTVAQLVNDGLMTVFFLVVGMEIKRELVLGELRTLGRAALPAVAAVGGMLVPGLVYFALNHGGPGRPGWGIPMATDIAFSVGVLTLLKSRVPRALVVFLTALAIFDDIGGILVIAVFYGHGFDSTWLLKAAGAVVGLYVLNRLYMRNGLVWAAGLVALWWSLHHGGIHATIAGVVVGLMVPSRPLRSPREVLTELTAHATELLARKQEEEDLANAELLAIEEKIEDLEAPLDRYTHFLHPMVAFGLMPLFALANSGVDLSGLGAGALVAPVALGAGLGLVLGKPVGIFLFTLVAVKAGLAPRPGDAGWVKVLGVTAVAGIGFTVALFIAGLAFPGQPAQLDEAKLGILVGSLVSGLLGAALLRATPLEAKL